MSDHCDHCGRDALSGLTLCRRCDRDGPRLLDGLHALLPDLRLTLARQDQLGPRSEGRAAETPLPFRERAGRTLRRIEHLTDGWVTEALATGAATSGATLAGRGLGGRLTYLRSVWPVLRRHEAASRLLADLNRTTSDALAAIDLPKHRSRVDVGPCPENAADNEGRCPGSVVALFPADLAERPTMECRTCGAVWPAEQWVRVGTRIDARRREAEAQEAMAATWAAKARSLGKAG